MNKLTSPISAKHFPEVSTSEEFLSSLYSIAYLQEQVSNDYDLLKVEIVTFKKNRISLIGNPFIRLHSKLVELIYLLKLHTLNCRVYNDLLFDDVEIDDNLNLQLKSLLATTKDLIEKYANIKEKLITTPTPVKTTPRL